MLSIVLLEIQTQIVEVLNWYIAYGKIRLTNAPGEGRKPSWWTGSKVLDSE